MIDEYWTWMFYGYHSDELSYGSGKPIVVRCDVCCQYRVVKKCDYRDFCIVCTQVGKRRTAEARLKMSKVQRGGKKPPWTNERKHAKSESQIGDKNKMYGRRGKDSPLFGREHSEAWKLNISKSLIGREFSKEHCNNLSLANIGRKTLPFTDDHKQKISASHQGIPYEKWIEYVSNGEYCEKFDGACRERIRAKYGCRCFICNKPQDKNITKNGKQKKLSVHHVDMNKSQGCDGHTWKLVPLCMKCHAKRSHSELWKSRMEYLLKEEELISTLKGDK